jgi:hypothetical protein
MAVIMKNCNEVTSFEPMLWHAMKGYVVLPKTIYADNKLFTEWLDKSITYVSTLPGKRKKLK